MEDVFIVPPLELGVYRHYKGNKYRVLGVGCYTETNEYFVVYRALQQKAGLPRMWIRPYDMFIETVEVDGKTISRFEKVGNE